MLNDEDLEPECSTNDTDECNVCNGGGLSCAPPSNIVTIGGRNEVALSWSMNIDAIEYNVYYDSDELIISTNQLEYVDTDLDYETEYCYYITSINNLGI